VSKKILQGEEARQALLDGVNELSGPVVSTLGPQGRNCVIQHQYGNPVSTRDGVTVARAVDISDPIRAVGARMVREVADRTMSVVGDGTTTSIVVAREIFRNGIEAVANGANPAAVKRGIDKAVLTVVGTRNETTGKYEGGTLQTLSIPVSGDMIRQVATVSANQDTAIGTIIAAAMEKSGADGVITVQDSKTLDTTLDFVSGMQFDQGFIAGQFVNTERRECVLEPPDGKFVYILLVDRKLATFSDITPFIEAMQNDRRPFLVIAEAVEGEALNAFVINNLKGIVQCCAVKSPGFGDRRKHMLQDIAVLTGGTVISDDTGTSLKNVKLEHLGKAKRITIDKDSTTIVDGLGHPLKVEQRAAEIRDAIEAAATDYDREKLHERLAKLASGVAIIKVGAVTDVELKEKKDRVDDAIRATQAAVEEGIVPGGGTALIRCWSALNASISQNEDEEEQIGMTLVLDALEAPTRQIVENAGLDADEVLTTVTGRYDYGFLLIFLYWLAECLGWRTAPEPPATNYGFNAATEEYEDLVAGGVIDAAKVIRVALQNAASVSSLMLTTESILVEMPEPPAPQPAPVAFQ
jgi:chaperonin GroEL